MVRQMTAPPQDANIKLTDAQIFEQKVYNLVHKYFPNALKEVYVYTSDKRIVEIDVILVHTSGIYLFEMKDKKGKITGTPTSVYWKAQHTEYKSSKFYSPLMQTETHVRHLARLYNISPASCHSIIVFGRKSDITDVRFSTNQTTLCGYSDLPHILKMIRANKNTPISPFILEDIYHDLSQKSGVQKFRNIHKEAVIRKKAKGRQPTHRTHRRR